RDAAPVNQTPGHDGRKCALLCGGFQSREQVLTRELLVQVRKGTEQTFRVALDEFSQSAPVERADILRAEDLFERVDGPGRLRSLATISVTVQPTRLRRRCQAITGARLQRKGQFAVARLFDLRHRLSEQFFKRR